MTITFGDPFTRVTFHGRLMDNKTMAGVLLAEKRLGYELSISQGCYNPGGVSASAGTHDGGGVIDLAPWDHDRKVRVLRDIGFAAWFRPAIPGLWPDHIHAVMIDHLRLSPAAMKQVVSYKQGRDGLKGDAVDPNPYRPTPIPIFRYPPKELIPKPSRPARARRYIETAAASLDAAAVELQKSDPGRTRAHRAESELDELLVRLRELHDKIPTK